MKFQKFTEWRPFVIARQWKKSLLGTFDLWWAYIAQWNYIAVPLYNEQFLSFQVTDARGDSI